MVAGIGAGILAGVVGDHIVHDVKDDVKGDFRKFEGNLFEHGFGGGTFREKTTF